LRETDRFCRPSPSRVRRSVFTSRATSAASSLRCRAPVRRALIDGIVEAIKKVVEFRENLESCARHRNEPKLSLRALPAQQRRPTTKCASPQTRSQNWNTPQNNLKLAIDETAVAADHLSEKMGMRQVPLSTRHFGTETHYRVAPAA